MTTSRKPVVTADDLSGLKLRVPPAKLFVDLFQTLGASPVAINLSDLYTALQTHVVDGTELPLATIDAQHINEVQGAISLTNHSWSGFFMLANPDSWKALPPDIQDVVRRNVEKYSALEIAEVNALNRSSLAKLQAKGMTVSRVETQTFRAKLGPFYARWKATFGTPAWDALERVTGPLG